MKLKVRCRPRVKSCITRKLISKGLVLGVLLNSIPINSFAGILSEDGRYETFEGSSIMIPDILEENKVDVEIEGNTLVNLVQFKDKELYSVSGNNRIERVIDGNFCTYRTIENTSSYITIRTGAHKVIKPNTAYTVYFTIKKNTIPDYNGFSIRTVSDAYFSGGNTSLYYNNNYLLTEGKHKVVVTTPSDISSCAGIGIGFKNIGESYPENLEFVIGEIMVLEGDWSNKEIPPYFEYMKSVGQDDINKNKIEIVSSIGKPNLIQNSGFLEGFSKYHILNNAQYLILDDFTAKSGKVIKVQSSDSPHSGLWQYININTAYNKKYTVSGWVKGDIDSILKISLEGHTQKEILLKDDSWIRFELISDTNPTNWNTALTFYSYTPNSTFYLKDIKLEESDVATPYIPHKNELNYDTFNDVNKNSITILEPLRALPNGVKDKIIKKNGQWYVERNIKEVILDGTENWVYDEENEVFRYWTNVPFIPVEANSNFEGLLADKLLAKIWWAKDEVKPDNVIYYRYACDSYSIIKTEFGSNAESLKKWLKENNVTFIGQLSEPVYEPINIDLSVQLFEGSNYILTNSTIPANIKVVVDRTINRATEAIELFKINPTTENLSKARMWINLLDDSITKDRLQGEINSITNLDDMVLERKSATANLDVYVKCENMLSLSLDTSSVTFEDFSGVEDLEELNAINLTINSSLPYQVNAYMPTEIKGSENSNTMDKDILNIKANGEAVYNTFIDADTPIVLLDNQPEGNGNIHGVDLMLKGNISHAKDVYKTTIKFEVVQK